MSGALLALWLCLAPPDIEALLRTAPTPEERPGAEVTWLRRERTVSVDAGGRVERVLRETLLLLREEGRRHATFDLGYTSADQTVKVVAARTIRPGGRVIDVGDQGLGARRVGLYGELHGDVLHWELSFPFADAGAVLDCEVAIADTRPTAAGSFEDRFVCDAPDPVESARYTVRFPTTTALASHVRGPLPAPLVRSRAGASEYVWQAQTLPGLGREPDAPPLLARATWVLVSTARSWEATAARYREVARPHYTTHAALKRAAERETAGQADPVAALYHYVVTGIRYSQGPLETGAPGITPRPATQTFDLRVGDCKDSATLLITLLRCVGQTAWPALVRRASSGPLAEAVPAMAQFDHVVVAVPSAGGWRWLDPTWSFGPASYLPPDVQGASALVVSDAGCEWRTLPHEPATANALRREGDFALGADGGLSGRVEVRASGGFEQTLRRRFAVHGPAEVSRGLTAALPELELEPDSVAMTPPAALAAPFVLRYGLRAARFGVGQRFLVFAPALLERASVPEPLLGGPRQAPVRLAAAPEQTENRLRFRLDPVWRVAEMPADETRGAPFGTYRVTCRLVGDTLEYQRHVGLTRVVLAPDELARARTWYEALAGVDRRRFVVLERR